MATTVTHRDYLQALDVPLTHLPTLDEEVDPYLPPEPKYHLFYALLRGQDDVSVAEALLTTLKERRDDLAAMIARYEVAHAIAP